MNNFHVNFVKNSNSLAGSAVKTVIGTPFTHLNRVNSTNIYAMEQLQAKLAEHGAVFFADLQTAGKGQMGKKWESESGQNLLMSILLNVSALNMGDQFALSAAIALAARDLLSEYISSNLTIKWPNDLYWGDRKAGGILIENQISGGIWTYAVIGIGININQTQFEGVQNKAVSLKQISGKEYHPIDLGKELCKKIELRFQELFVENGKNKILSDYNEVLYKKSQRVKLKYGNIASIYLIDGVSKKGDLLATSSMQHQFKHGEVEWIIES
ncbi:biotin--[acetyl-CoA-carboxylase] ligase [Sediminibacterium sp.]|uniref:biotin--[acetyl-CoA-carboxylase] ligase n=1 Tax=Sediminibacterium sp. TaxID=1917865 RepID=UPI003F716495